MIPFACLHLKALGKLHKANASLFNRSSIWTSSGCREVASHIEAKPLSCCICWLLSVGYPGSPDSAVLSVGTCASWFKGHHFSWWLGTCPDLCVPAWISDSMFWLSHRLNGPWLLATPHTCPRSGRLHPSSDTSLSQAPYPDLCPWLVMTRCPNSITQIRLYGTVLHWLYGGCLLSWTLRRKDFNDNH